MSTQVAETFDEPYRVPRGVSVCLQLGLQHDLCGGAVFREEHRGGGWNFWCWQCGPIRPRSVVPIPTVGEMERVEYPL